MKAALLILALCASALAVDTSMFTKQQEQSLAQIKSSKWGSWIIDFAEVHLQAQGPLQELLDAINELIDDLNNELAEVKKNFARRTDEHNREVIRLQQEVDSASRDLFNGHDMIDNVLIPQRDRLRAAIEQLANNIAQNRNNLQVETKQRENEHAAFEGAVQEHNDALEAVDESLGLLAQLNHVNLIQVKKIQSNLNHIENKIKNHNGLAPIVKALVALATESNFANPEAVAEIVAAFNSLRNELVDSLNNLVADENAAQATFNARVVQLNAEHADFQRQTLFRNAELTRTEEKLVQNEEYVDQRTVDKATFEGQFAAENDNYAQETDAYNNLVAQYQRELGAADQAYALLTQPSFTAYVNSKGGF